MAQRCPEPPAPGGLPRLEPGDVLDTAGVHVARIYSAGGSWPATWNAFRAYGPVRGMRFEHHPRPRGDHPSYGVSYGAVDWHPAGPVDPLPCTVAETSRGFVVDRHTSEPWLSIFRPTRALRLLLLSDSSWLARAHGNAALMAGSTAVAQRWARRLWQEYRDLDGLCWSSSPYPSSRSIVLFERAASALPARPALNVPLTHPGLTAPLSRIAADLRYPLL